MSENAPVSKRAIALLGLATLAGVLGGAAWTLWNRFGPNTYARYDTMFGKAKVYHVADDDGQMVRLLEVGGIVQSGTYVDERYTELVFEYLKNYDVVFDVRDTVKRVCVLGCGGYDYPEHLVANHDGLQVDAVEIDPAITAIARRHFFLDRLIEEYRTEETHRLNLICADALAHLESCGGGYDAIVNDTFDAGTPPEHLTTVRFMRAAHDALADGGLFLTNIVSPLEGPDSMFLSEQVALLGMVFSNVVVLPCSKDALTEPDNVIVVASDGDLGGLGGRAAGGDNPMMV